MTGSVPFRRAALAPARLTRTAWRHRFLLVQLARRAFFARHAGNYLGWLWTPVSVAVQFAVFMVVFSVILEIKVGSLGIDLARKPRVGFGVFLITGLVPYLAINDAVLRASRVFKSHVNLVQRVRFPAEVLVLGDAFGALLHHAAAFALVIVLCAGMGHLALAEVPWLVLGTFLVLLWVVGLALTASVLGALFPDVVEVLGLLMQVAFYTAPIVYPLAMVERETLRAVIRWNPITPLIGVLRTGLIAAEPPPVWAVVGVVAGGAALVWCGAAALEIGRSRIPDLL